MEPTISPATVRAVAAYAEHRAISIDLTLREGRYPLSEVVDLWSRAQAAARDPLIGRRAAALVPFGAFGIVEHLMLLSSTLEDALHRLVRYYPLVNQAFALTMRKRRSDVLLELHASDGTRILPQYADFVLASIRRRLDLARGIVDRYIVAQPFAGTPAISIATDCIHERLPFADEDLCEALETVGGHRLASRRTTADLVSDAISSRIAGRPPTLVSIAQQFGLSGRTLQRRLIAEGTSFRRVLDERRRTMALQLLRRDLPIKSLADRLGFAEVRSFHRAFRRWTSTTPGQLRASR